jgi:hypothetical protein
LIGGFKVDPTLPSVCEHHHTEQQITLIEVNDITGWYVCSLGILYCSGIIYSFSLSDCPSSLILVYIDPVGCDPYFT